VADDVGAPDHARLQHLASRRDSTTAPWLAPIGSGRDLVRSHIQAILRVHRAQVCLAALVKRRHRRRLWATSGHRRRVMLDEAVVRRHRSTRCRMCSIVIIHPANLFPRGSIVALFSPSGGRGLTMARIVRCHTLSLRQREFIDTPPSRSPRPSRSCGDASCPKLSLHVIARPHSHYPAALLFDSFLSSSGSVVAGSFRASLAA